VEGLESREWFRPSFFLIVSPVRKRFWSQLRRTPLIRVFQIRSPHPPALVQATAAKRSYSSMVGNGVIDQVIESTAR